MSESPASSAASQPLDTHSPPAPASQANETTSPTGLETARKTFQETGLAFPQLPPELAVALEQKDIWVFATREVKMALHDIDLYVAESFHPPPPYLVLADAGHGFSAHNIIYYQVFGPLHLFLQSSWGGVSKVTERDALEIEQCFTLADEILQTAKTSGKLKPDEKLIIVCKNTLCHWALSLSGDTRRSLIYEERPSHFLARILRWLKNPKPRHPRPAPVRQQVVVS
ncbi:hypothetical protein [Prosthecobacter sp.]|uniref:hypothetical protein n=1 Tax=Prosthecobacter sp. TaxID=1965333 RepID=UPI0037838137